MAEGGGLLNRYRVVKPYRGFESLRLRQPSPWLRLAYASKPAAALAKAAHRNRRRRTAIGTVALLSAYLLQSEEKPDERHVGFTT